MYYKLDEINIISSNIFQFLFKVFTLHIRITFITGLAVGCLDNAAPTAEKQRTALTAVAVWVDVVKCCNVFISASVNVTNCKKK